MLMFRIVVCRSVGTVPDILGLVWPRFRTKSGSKSKIPGRFRGPFSSAELVCAGFQGRRPMFMQVCRRALPGDAVLTVATLGHAAEANKNYPMLRNSASGPEIGLPGRMSAGF